MNLSRLMQADFCSEIAISNQQICTLSHFFREDIPEVLSVENTANPHPWSERNFIDSVESSHICLMGRVSNESVAHCVLSIASGEAELLILSVHPMWQRRGIARGILQQMFQDLEDFAAEIFLEVRVSNLGAIELYEGLGFNNVGTRPGYYPNGADREDALIYARSLRITNRD